MNKISISLNRNEWEQIVDGLEARRASWEATVRYLEGEEVDQAIEECRAAEEPRAVAATYHRLKSRGRTTQPVGFVLNRFSSAGFGAFEIRGHVPASPVLLVDDVIDSGWTMTVIAALLRNAGSGEVLPFALADSSTGT